MSAKEEGYNGNERKNYEKNRTAGLAVCTADIGPAVCYDGNCKSEQRVFRYGRKIHSYQRGYVFFFAFARMADMRKMERGLRPLGRGSCCFGNCKSLYPGVS